MTGNSHRFKRFQLLRIYLNVIYALLMHDIKSRYFGNGWGQVVMVIWPFVHILSLIILYHFSGRITPYGDSLILYSSIGVLPFIIFSYMSRWISFGAVDNRSFLQYPIIRTLDLMIARFILEFITAVIVTVLLLLVLELLGEDCMPVNYSEAACAWCASVFLALGVGFLSAALAILFYFWNMAYTFIILLAYVSSGILFVSSSLPPPVRQALSWNPLLHCIEWMRSAYYVDYNSVVLDKVYLLSFSFLSLVAGLLLERYTRRYKS